MLVVNKIDRPDARVKEVVDEVYELFLDLDADESQIEFPILYANARAGQASADPDRPGTDLKPLFEMLLEHIPAPEYEEGHPLQALVTNLDASPVRRAAGAVPRAQRHDPARAAGRVVPRRRNRRAGEGHRAVRDRGARPRGGRRGRAGRDHRGRRHRRGDDRRDAGRPGRPPSAPGDARRRAEPVDDDRHQHVAAVGRQRDEAHRAAGQEPARPGGRRQRLDPRAGHRPARHLGGAGPRRAAAGGPGRDDAPRGLRADGRQAPGGHPNDRRHGPRAGRAGRDRRPRGVLRRRHPAARAPQGPGRRDGEPRHRLGPDGRTSSRRAA